MPSYAKSTDDEPAPHPNVVPWALRSMTLYTRLLLGARVGLAVGKSVGATVAGDAVGFNVGNIVGDDVGKFALFSDFPLRDDGAFVAALPDLELLMGEAVGNRVGMDACEWDGYAVGFVGLAGRSTFDLLACFDVLFFPSLGLLFSWFSFLFLDISFFPISGLGS